MVSSSVALTAGTLTRTGGVRGDVPGTDTVLSMGGEQAATVSATTVSATTGTARRARAKVVKRDMGLLAKSGTRASIMRNWAYCVICAAKVAGSMLAPHTTTPTRCPFRRSRSGYISAASAAAPAGSTASLAVRNNRRMAARI